MCYFVNCKDVLTNPSFHSPGEPAYLFSIIFLMNILGGMGPGRVGNCLSGTLLEKKEFVALILIQRN